MLVGSKLHHSLFAMQKQNKDDATPGFQNFPAYKKPTKRYEPSRDARQIHMSLDLHVQFENDRTHGQAFLVFEGNAAEVKSVTIDAKELNIASVEFAPLEMSYNSDGLFDAKTAPVKFIYADDVISVTLPSPLQRGDVFCLKVAFSSENPKAGIYFVHAKKSSDAEYDCVWTQGQDVDSPFWFPCQDDPRLKMTTTTRFHFPATWHGVGNGVLIQEKVTGATKTQTWKMTRPHSPYLVAFAAGDMAYQEDTWRQKKVTVLLPKKYSTAANQILSETKAMLEFYSNYWGYEFPWEKYAQAFVADFLYGGMENTTVTINSDNPVGPVEFAKASEHLTFLVMHEMAHQWFGDTLTCETWSEGWLNEGFATHSEMLWDEHVNGRDSAIFYSIVNDKGWYLEEAQSYLRPIVTNTYEYVSEIFDGHLYSKGALVLNHLRDLIGEQNFRNSIGHYLRSNEFKPVRTPDLIRAIEETTGWNPRKFFDTYVYRAGHVEVDVSLKLSTVLEIECEQKQKISADFPAFEFETFIFLQYEDGSSEEVRVNCTQTKETLFVPVKKPLAFAVFDPRDTLVGEAKQKLPENFAQAMLKADAPYKVGAYHAYLAAKSLMTNNVTKKNCELIANWLKREKCVRARYSAYEMIAASNSPDAYPLLKSVEENEPKARIAYVDSLAKAATADDAAELQPLLRKVGADTVEALHVREKAIEGLRTLAQKTPALRATPLRMELMDYARKLMSSTTYLGIVEAAAISLFAELTDEKALPVYAGILENRVQAWRPQVAALSGLAKLSQLYPNLRGEVRPHLLRYAKTFFPVRVAASLPTLWVETKDPVYGEAFDHFVQRKNYGLLSMLIPRARRQAERYHRGLDTPALADKVAEVPELKAKLTKLEKELEALREVMSKKPEDNKSSTV